MKLFLANGCSHTAGTDINPNKLNSCAEEAWPRWVADHYNIPYVNIAEVGSGNEQISRSTFITISNIIELDNVNPKNLIVGICWSGFDRYEYWDSENNKHKSFALSSTSVVNPPKDIVKRYIETRSLIEPEEYSNYKNLYYMIQTAKFLESYGIKYYFSNCLNSFDNPSNISSEQLKNEYINLLNLYGDRIDNHLGFFDNSQTLRTLLQPIKYSPYGNGYHWGREGQQLYANYFIKHMEEVDGRMGN